jgi:hypothetical protein
VAITNGLIDSRHYSVGLSATGWLVRSPSLYWQAIRASWNAIDGDMSNYTFNATTSAGYRTSMGAAGRSEFRVGVGAGYLMAKFQVGDDDWSWTKTYEDWLASFELAYSKSTSIPNAKWVFVLEALFPMVVEDNEETLDPSYLLHVGLGF